MKKINLNEIEYEIIKDYKNALNIEELKEKITDYFDNYDYILGDYSYDKLRLKGFCENSNEIFKNINDYNMIEKYLKDFCSYDCKYFILKKVSQKLLNNKIKM